MEIKLEKNTSIMFVRCNSSEEIMCQLPDVVTGYKQIFDKDEIKLEYIFNEKSLNLSLNDITSFYYQSIKITFEQYLKASNKIIVFTINLKIEQMLNLQYLLVLCHYLRNNNFRYYIILDLEDNSNDSYFKLYHYFAMQYDVYYNTFIRINKKLTKFPGEYVPYIPGEIIPFFLVDNSLYEILFQTFEFNDTIFDFKNKKMDNKVTDELISLYKNDIAVIDNNFSLKLYLFINNYIYSSIMRNDNKGIIDFIKNKPSTPLFVMFLFAAILNKGGKNLTNYHIIYENCFNYAFTLEQAIENSLFYAKNGALSIRIHKATSLSISNYFEKMDDNFGCKFLIEVSLIDFQEKHISLIEYYINNLPLSQNDKVKLIKKVNLHDVFSGNIVQYDGFRKNNHEGAEEMIQHYGLNTIDFFSKKTDTFLYVKSNESGYNNINEYYYRDNYNHPYYRRFDKNSIEYKSGVLYKILIPIKDTDINIAPFIGFYSKNPYDSSTSAILCLDHFCDNIPIPKNRDEKIKKVYEIVDSISKNIPNDVNNKILLFNVSNIKNRLQLEYLIKSILFIMYSGNIENKQFKFALIGFKNKTYIKMVIKFFQIYYHHKEGKKLFRLNEIFMCTEDCKIEIFISGENYDDILNNLFAQKVFGTIDEDIFNEMKSSINIGDKI